MSAQMGKSDLVLDLIGQTLDQRPTPVIYVGPSKDFLVNQFEPRIMELLDQAPSLAAKVARGKRMKKLRKEIAGVPLRLAYAGSATPIKSDPVGLGLIDEYCDMKRIKGAGDPLALLQARGDTYADFVTVATSTPSEGVVSIVADPKSGIEFWSGEPEDVACPQFRLFLQGTRRHWCWKCKDCERYFVPRFRLLRWRKGALPTEALAESWVQCPRCEADYTGTDESKADCRGRHFEADKPGLNRSGLYVAPGQVIVDGVVEGEPPSSSINSWWVSGLASPFVTFGKRAERWLTATRSADPEQIRAAINQGFGELWAPSGGEMPELAEVMNLCLPYKRCEVPTGVILITAGVDVQKNRLIPVVRGWGARGESWLIDYREIYGDTSQPEVWHDLADYLETPFADNRRIRLALIDSGFRPNKKDTGAVSIVYDFCREHQRFCAPAKGWATLANGSPMTISKIEVAPSGKRAKYSLELIRVNTDFAKSWVHQRIAWPADTPGAFHLPDDLPDEYFAQILSESRVRLPSGRVEWIQRSKENHALDSEALAFIAGYRLNVHRIPDTRRARSTRLGNDTSANASAAEAKPEIASAPVAMRRRFRTSALPAR
jgi:phage terminase large subunit GpA-like protein